MKNTLYLLVCLSFTQISFSQVFGPSTLIADEDVSYINAVVAMDVDLDGDQDLIGIALDDLCWYENLGSGASFAARQDIDNSNSPRSWYAADINADGAQDLVIGDRDNDRIFYYRNTIGGFASPVTVSNPDGVLSVHAADLNGDGHLDILYTTSKDVAWMSGDGTGVFGLPQIIMSVPFSESYRAVLAADFDNDGDLDVAYGISFEDRIAWHINAGAGVFGAQQLMLEKLNGVASLETIDVDHDGDLDLVGASDYFAGRVAWFENTGSGNFGARSIVANGVDGPEGLVVADVNSDGLDDIIIGSYYDFDVLWFENLGGSFSGKKYIRNGTANNVTDVTAADLNGDGYVDVMAATVVLFNPHEYIWFENLTGIPACNSTMAPVSPVSTVGTDNVTLSWGAIPLSVGCQINATRLSPTGPSVNKSFLGFELASVTVPFSQLGAGTTWQWRSRCACETSPLDVTPYSVYNTFSVPAPRLANNFSIQPNPASDLIQLQSSEEAMLQIYSVTGQVMYSGLINGISTVDVSTFTAGVYFAEWSTKPGETIKLIIQN